MAVELGASRLLSPYFSSSQIVWTIIIGTIMVAMALGNIYGGRSADKNPNPDILYGRILIAGVWIGLIPVLGKYIIVGLSGLIDGIEIDEKITDLARDVYTVDASGWTNRELFASNSEDMISNLEKNISALNNSESSFYSLSNTDAENNSKNTFELSSAKNAELASMMDTVSENLVKYNAGSYILTDDKAPVEVLSMRVLDKMIQEEVGYYKDIYHKKGLKGLLDEL